MKIWIDEENDDRQETESQPATDTDEQEEVRVDRSDRHILYAILFEVLMGAFVWLKSAKAGMNYLYILVPMLVITGLAGNYAYQKNADMKLFGAVAKLSAAGIGLQLTIDQVYNPIGTFSVIKYLISLVIAMIFLIFYSYFRKLLNKQGTVYVMMAVSAAIYLFLAVKGYDPNGYGTNAWISIAGFTIQMTDFTKVSALLFYASLFSSQLRFEEDKVLLLSTIFFLINLGGSILIRELGSFFILFFLHLGLIFIFMKHSHRKRMYLIIMFVLFFGSAAALFGLYKLLDPSYQAGTLKAPFTLLYPLCKKVYERFSVTANIYYDPYGAGYQLLQGKKALWMGGLFGNTVNFNAIPVAESDMAFVAMVAEFGWVLALYCIFMLCRIGSRGCAAANRLLKHHRQDAVVAFGAAFMLVMQGLIVILGSCNIIPFTGLPIPFLSRGFTYQTIVFCFTGTLLHLSEQEEESEDETDA